MGKSNSKLSSEELKELQESTYFEKKEIQQWYKGFLKDCPNGKLNRTEFMKIYKLFFPFGDSSQFSVFVFNIFDRNGDGDISFNEFLKALSITSRGTPDEKLRWVFNLYDLDQDGAVNRQEMLRVIEAIYMMMGSMVQLPEDEDTPQKRDEDDSITFDEFKKGSMQDEVIKQAMNLYQGLI
ncbi:Calcium-binding protein NCS-1 [Mycoemilia scoparia]|uniref:Calcium-binding protein NCS-1 n=1 Tax=Mycoemilia scoparia TaxID=417184 RepID=A0A9W8A026_9FUNG|nr:Calcium-binding protein NCS-1 [Mycoemilia scoparia]